MKYRLISPLFWLVAFILMVGLACSFGAGSEPTPVPPSPTNVPELPTEVPTPVPPTPTPVPTDTEPPPPSPTPIPPPTEAATPTEIPPTEVPQTEAPSYYFEEFDFSASSFYPDEYFYFVQSGPDNVADSVYVDNGKLVFNIDTANTWIYLYYGPWVYTDVRIGMEADNLGANSQSVSLFCRYNPDRGWVEFNVAGDGTYSIFAYDALQGSGYNRLYNGGSTAINIGKQTNTYIAECNGDTISLYVNNTEVRTLTIPNNYRFLDEGYVGFSASSFDSLPVVLEIEWFGIEAP